MAENTSNITLAHVAIIMDGNGRWANKKHKPRAWGHLQGAKVAKAIIEHVSKKTDVKVLTLWGYSTDNNKRPEAEIEALMGIFQKFITANTEELRAKNVRVTFIGDFTKLPKELQQVAQTMSGVTASNTGLHLQIALNYGGEDELVRAVCQIAQKAALGQLSASAVTIATIYAHLDTAGVSNPDLVIRTGDEQRLSGFMPLQAGKAELVFVKQHWPDFTPVLFDKALAEYNKRERRFGGLNVAAAG